MSKPRLLDLFSGAGGAAVGYHRAGFEVVGVDLHPQKNYPFEFHQADAMTFPLEGFDVIHASPPCQAHTALKAMWNAREHPDLIPATRERLRASGKPYVIENVPGSPLKDYLTLCGSMFKLGCEEAELRRHRWFETNPRLFLAPECQHDWKAQTIACYGHSGGWSNRVRERTAVIGVYGDHGRDRRRRMNGQNFSVAKRAEAMGIDWMTGKELTQAIPPAFCEWIGRALRRR